MIVFPIKNEISLVFLYFKMQLYIIATQQNIFV